MVRQRQIGVVHHDVLKLMEEGPPLAPDREVTGDEDVRRALVVVRRGGASIIVRAGCLGWDHGYRGIGAGDGTRIASEIFRPESTGQSPR
jgi:hypothetical protein